MNKTIHSLLFVSLSAIATTSAQAADTSRLFTSETANTLKKGAVSLDLEYDFSAATSAGVATSLRTGAFGGEIMLNSASDDHSGFAGTSIGYKKSIGKGLAAYGVVSHYDDGDPGAPVITSATNFAVGAAYTLKSGALTYNLNPEFVTDDGGLNNRGDKSTLFIKGSVQYKLKKVPVSLVAEVVLDNNSNVVAPVERNISLGARWQPKKNLTLDFIVYHDTGLVNVDEITGLPGYVIVNYLF